METKNTDKTKSWLSEGLIILSISAFSYLLSFFFELGYTGYFGIPWQFISPTYVSISIALLSLIVFGVLMLHLFNTIFGFLHEITRHFPKLKHVPFSWGVYIVLLIAILSIMNSPSSTIWKFCLLLLVVLGIIDFLIRPILRKIKNLPPGGPESTQYIELNGPLGKFRHRFGFGAGRALAFGFYLLFFILVLGANQAKNESNFLTTQTDASVVVLRIYGDRAITAQFDRETKKIEKSFTILKLGEGTEESFAIETIGPLQKNEK